MNFANPFRPGAGHAPPYLAGRKSERREFLRLLGQTEILENMVLTGLRGVGKTAFLDSLKPEAIENGWAWVGTDLSESTSIGEDSIAVRICTDLSLITAGIVAATEELPGAGFAGKPERRQRMLDYQALLGIYQSTPGLALDKLKAVLAVAWAALYKARQPRGIIFAYDEAQNLSDRSARDQFPLSLLLDAFQSVQKNGLPLMLVLTGLPALFPNLVEARTYSERMFRVIFLASLAADESEEAILKPVADAKCPVRLGPDSVAEIVEMSAGYPYFIQFICREVYDAFLQKIDQGEKAVFPAAAIERKLDTDFFAGRWARATDRQRELLSVIAKLKNCDEEFTVKEIVALSKNLLKKPFGDSHVNQMLAIMSARGLVFKNRHGKYSLAVPLLGRFIKRQELPVSGAAAD